MVNNKQINILGEGKLALLFLIRRSYNSIPTYVVLEPADRVAPGRTEPPVEIELVAVLAGALINCIISNVKLKHL